MAAVEMDTAGMQGEQKESTLTLPEEDASPVLNETSAPLNFSELKPLQFGISAQSFIPLPSNHKSTSRLAQIKARRRSSIGVRGSPETNSLIRFMAQQRMKKPPAHQTPEHNRSSPFPPQVTPTLKQKMATFQSLMDVEETEVCDRMPRQDGDGAGCIKTRDYVPDCNDLHRGKENNPPMTPTPSKRRCLGPPEGCEVEIREASAPSLHFTLKAQEQDSVFELQSPRQTPTDDPAAISPTQLVSPFHVTSLPSLQEMEPKEKNHPSGTSAVRKKKKVRFGGPLSPELFDKNLPPSTPLQKGGTPARAPTPAGALRSLLKTPQRDEPHTSPAQPDFSSPTAFGASPILAMPRRRRGVTNKDEDRKIVFPSMEDSALKTTGEVLEVQPLNLNNAFHEESFLQMVTECETKPSEAPQMDLVDELTTFSHEEKKPEAVAEASAPAESRKRRKELPGPECAAASGAPARCRSRKRKEREESEPVKRSTRSAATSASGKMKMTSTAARRWNRDVDRSLYGSRKYASKNPNLSPITERLSLVSRSAAAALQASSAGFTGVMDQETCSDPEMADDTGAVDEHAMTNALKDCSEGSVTSRIRVRGLKKRKLAVGHYDEEPRHQTGDTEEHHKRQTTTTSEASNVIPLESTAPDQGGVEVEPHSQISVDAPSIATRSTLPSSHPPLGEGIGHTLHLPEAPALEEQVRGSSVTDRVEEDLAGCSASENGLGERAASPVESGSGSGGQEGEGVAIAHLAPWQADFNFEDVFQPAATRGQRSVRRSLRNQRNSGHSRGSAGLAWVPRVSPDSSKDSRRRTRGRRLSAALVRPSLEEPLDSMS